MKYALYNYLKTRFPISHWGGLVILFTFAGSPLSNSYLLLVNFCISLCFLFSFRLLDDLTSLTEDKLRHPERILTRLSGHKFYWFVSISLSLIPNLIIYLKGKWIICILYLLIYLFNFKFPFLKSGIGGSKLFTHISLLKYPFLLLLLNINSDLVLYENLIFYPFLTIPFIINENRNVIWPFYVSGVAVLLLKIL